MVDDEKQHHEGFQHVYCQCRLDRQSYRSVDGWYSFYACTTVVMPYHILFYQFSNSLFWGLGASAGMASWFYILVNVIKIYQDYDCRVGNQLFRFDSHPDWYLLSVYYSVETRVLCLFIHSLRLI